MVKIVAEFPSVDMATLAIKSITAHVGGVESVKINYKKHSTKPKNDILSSFFATSSMANTFFTNESIGYPVNLNAIREKEQQQAHTYTSTARLELTAGDAHTQVIKSNLRSYGGLNIRVYG